ncbi:MAG TPA: acetyl-CoA carboxylase biotin carboxylase subunit [Thermoanaerobaculaceae bacterium]|mgnify:CR=1 FL=1|nr:acetyl-CoA carboxylase biotin carboxylase subunit [Thermoanaerobaculaceae bacterium]HRS15683.1 acetyl-CoA carboxylase biotin carboxylase subunit [Thermoanaerobaculaceae bacterium]
MTTRAMRKVLIANRGEIAVRIIRACREMGLRSVAVFSAADRAALHVRLADEAYFIGPSPASQSYLNVQALLDVAARSRADAVAPGYGFLAENEEFAQACVDRGLIFVGPSPAAIRAMGDKIGSRNIAAAAGVPLVPGLRERLNDAEEAVRRAEEIGFPVMLKASAGGGGKGLRIARSPAEVRERLPLIRSEAAASFGDDTVYLEKVIERPRHVEIQVLGDEHGNLVHLGDRECSLQRRHQKVAEEAPSPIMTPELRARMGEAALRLARAVGYSNAGTVEFLVDSDRNFYFLEMNTRLQVEHPVTEMVTGFDLVAAQLRIAAGEPLWLRQEDVTFTGHAIECRIYAEDPDNGFAPCPGRIVSLHEPSGPGIRNDNGMYEGLEISIFYDPLISKLVAHAPTRARAIDRMLRALKEFKIGGIKTNIPYFMRIFADPDFRAGAIDTSFLDRSFADVELALPGEETMEELQRIALLAAAVRHHLELSQAPCACPEVQRCSPWRMAGRRRLTGW